MGGVLQPATVSFTNGIITAVTSGMLSGATDFGDSVIMPGIIDAHVHINEPGRTDWEGFESATLAAAMGGVTTVVDMPLNASPVTTNTKAFSEKLAATENKLHVNCGFYGGLIPGNLQELEPLIRAKVLGIKCFLTHSGIDEFPNVTEADLDAAMPLIAAEGIPLLAHCELSETSLQSDNERISYQQYLASRPKKWENDAIAMMIRLCRKYNCKTHIVHVSSAEALTLIAAAKKEGLPCTAETCPHYIYFNSGNIPDNNTLFKCAPPIREKENNEQLKQALRSGVLDFITTDHSPAPPDIKELESGDLKKAWGGIAGLQFLLQSSWTALKDTLSLEEFIPLLTYNPAHFLNIHDRKGLLAPGYDGDVIVWDPGSSFIASREMLQHRHKISPYIGERLYGTVQLSFVNGEVAYEATSGTSANTFGKIILNPSTQ